MNCLARLSYSKVKIQDKYSGEFMMSLKNTSDRLNKDLDLYYNIDPIQYLREMDKINKQTACFVCGKEFDEKTGCHLHHDHKQKRIT